MRQQMSDMLQLVVDLRYELVAMKVESVTSQRQAEGNSEQVTDLFSTVRGSGWPRLTKQAIPCVAS